MRYTCNICVYPTHASAYMCNTCGYSEMYYMCRNICVIQEYVLHMYYMCRTCVLPMYLLHM